jgi:preprotein translocase subunit SecA
MTLYEEWLKKAYTKKGAANNKHWEDYKQKEIEVFSGVIAEKTTRIEGSVDGLSKRFGMPVSYVCGFIDGINEVIKETIDLNSLTEESHVVLEFEFGVLYKKMVEFKADYLYTLPQWDSVFTVAERKALFDEQKRSGTVVREAEKIGRNDPCPCGSGLKYKKCCGGADE